MKILEAVATADGRHIYSIAEICLDGQTAFQLALLESGSQKTIFKDSCPFPTLRECRDALNTAIIACTDNDIRMQRAGVA